ncbi:FMN-dependent oxidoreductase, nitrilotriacetate monooxygenase family protein [Burkholderia pseudomallei]|nr:FMN-dependent oxidoreductase, nitrilotriacetate monooxygenase family protein [Burkholderia pseudomallei]
MHEHRQMHLNCHIVGVGQHPAGWRTLRNTRAIVDPDFYRRVARVAEQGKFDALFFSDSLSLHGHAHGPSQMLDPLVVASSLALVTERIGLICTASTTFSDPFSLARRFLSLDQMSGGRAGWNAVTTYNPAAAANFGPVALPSAAERYARADEFIDVTIKLWESWGERALVADAASGVFADPAQVRRIDHHGRHFDIAGPLNVPRSPQGRPLLVQAGASEAGLELAARHADMVFTSQHSLEGAQRFYADLKSRVHAKGRDPDQFGILPGLYRSSARRWPRRVRGRTKWTRCAIRAATSRCSLASSASGRRTSRSTRRCPTSGSRARRGTMCRTASPRR